MAHPPKYGLIKMQGLAKGLAIAPKKAAPVFKALGGEKPVPTAFSSNDGSDDDDDASERRNIRQGIDVGGMNKAILHQQAHSSRLVEKAKEQALAQDASIYSYDEVYDDMQSDKGQRAQARAKDFDL